MAKRKPTKRRSPGKKKTTRKKKEATRKQSGKRKAVVRRKPKKKIRRPGKVTGPKLPTDPVGRVTHYFPKARATAVMIERDEIKVGDTLYFKGHTTRFKQTIESLQINHEPVSQASPGDEVGIRVKSRTREHDLVFRL